MRKKLINPQQYFFMRTLDLRNKINKHFMSGHRLKQIKNCENNNLHLQTDVSVIKTL